MTIPNPTLAPTRAIQYLEKALAFLESHRAFGYNMEELRHSMTYDFVDHDLIVKELRDNPKLGHEKRGGDTYFFFKCESPLARDYRPDYSDK